MSKEDIWADGYYDGYKAATKWHYPSKGEYPKKNVEVLCRLWFGGYIVSHLREDDEFCAGRVAFNVECWQYIIPPQEEA